MCRIKPKKEEEEAETTQPRNKIQFKKDRLGSRRKDPLKSATSTTTTSTTTGSSLIVTPSYTTPAPPPTPDPGSGKLLVRTS